jgi:hypothetical protein
VYISSLNKQITTPSNCAKKKFRAGLSHFPGTSEEALAAQGLT